MSDWAVGDLAVCVDASDCGGYGFAGPLLLVEGRAYEVVGVTAPGPWNGGSFDIGLCLQGCVNPGSLEGDWFVGRFRKIRPDAREGEINDWELLLDSVKRKVSA